MSTITLPQPVVAPPPLVGDDELYEVIVETLHQDPRPVVYKGFESSDSPYRNKHAFKLYDGDIHFEFNTDLTVEVFDIIF